MKEYVVIEALLANLERFVSSQESNIDLYAKGFKGSFNLTKYEEWVFSLEDIPSKTVSSSSNGLKRRLKVHQLIYQFDKATTDGDQYILCFRTVSGKMYRALYIRHQFSAGMGTLKLVSDL